MNTPAVPAVAIDYTAAFEQGGGIGRLVREMTAALARRDTQTDYRLFVAGVGRAPLPVPPGANFTFRPTRLSTEWLARLWQRARVPLPVETFTGTVALYHATDFVLPPTRPRTRTLLTVHDLTFARVPDAAPPNLKAYLDHVVPRSVRRADHLIADSQATKDDLVALYNTPPDRITVVLSGVDPHFRPITDSAVLHVVRSRYNLPARPYLFALGTVQPRKNFTRLVHALAWLRARGHDVDLVIAGGRGWAADPLYAAIHTHNLSEHVHLIGFARDEDLPALYSGAALLAYPSLYEGFGLPILEAFACGTPVLSASVSSMPEVAGDAALLVSPTDQDAINAALEQLLTDSALRDTLTRRGAARAAQFTWDRAAAALQAVYQRFL